MRTVSSIPRLMHFDPEQYRVHESAAGLATPFEHDDETSELVRQVFFEELLTSIGKG